MNFERLATGIDVAPVLAELEAQPHLWREITLRQDYPGSAHHDTECIFIRGPHLPPGATLAQVFDTLTSEDYPAIHKLPSAVALMRNLLVDMGIENIGRVMIVNLHPGGVIDPHVDEGEYAEVYERFHLVLSSEEGNLFTTGGESVHMKPGELWWFNHRREHTVVNHSDKPRLHLIFDAVRKGSKITYQQERAKDVLSEIMPLLRKHHREIAHYPDIPLDPDLDAYLSLDAAGVLRAYTVRNYGRLIGYCVYFIRPNLHYRTSLQALQDVLFLLPEYRRGGVGRHLLNFAGRQLKAEGVQVEYQHHKAAHNLSPLLEAEGFELVDLIHARRLDTWE